MGSVGRAFPSSLVYKIKSQRLLQPARLCPPQSLLESTAQAHRASYSFSWVPTASALPRLSLLGSGPKWLLSGYVWRSAFTHQPARDEAVGVGIFLSVLPKPSH